MSLFTLTSAVPGRMCLILLLFAAFVPPPATPENETGVLFPEIQNPKSKIQNHGNYFFASFTLPRRYVVRLLSTEML